MEWVAINEKLPKSSGIIRVKKENGDDVKAYYHSDQMVWILRHYKEGTKTSYFQDYSTHKYLFDVTHWKYLEKIKEETNEVD